ncbi:MAG: hypothetical protein ACRDYA_19640 [Egibacteraceae bacterium]
MIGPLPEPTGRWHSRRATAWTAKSRSLDLRARATRPADDRLGRSPAERRAETNRLAEATSAAEATKLTLPPVDDQRTFASASTGARHPTGEP